MERMVRDQIGARIGASFTVPRLRRQKGTGEKPQWMTSRGTWRARYTVSGHRRAVFGPTSEACAAKRDAALAELPPVASSPPLIRRRISLAVRFRVLERCGFACTYCGARAPEVRLEIDHILAVADGGADDESNLTTACDDCNRGKGAARLAEEFRAGREAVA